ncbi:MAG: hypothetical protein L6367_07445 [Cellulomonas sp.]|nr:hypothetical protein [Cellulomonas sp.]
MNQLGRQPLDMLLTHDTPWSLARKGGRTIITSESDSAIWPDPIRSGRVTSGKLLGYFVMVRQDPAKVGWHLSYMLIEDKVLRMLYDNLLESLDYLDPTLESNGVGVTWDTVPHEPEIDEVAPIPYQGWWARLRHRGR